MKLSNRKLTVLIGLLSLCMALPGCGNKGPLVKPADASTVTPAAATPAVEAPAGNAASTPESSSGSPAARH